MLTPSPNSKHRFALVGGTIVLAGCMTVGPQTAYRVGYDFPSSDFQRGNTTLRPAEPFSTQLTPRTTEITPSPSTVNPEPAGPRLQPPVQDESPATERPAEPLPGGGRDRLNLPSTRGDDGLSNQNNPPATKPPLSGSPSSEPPPEKKSAELELPPLQPVLPKIEPGEISIPARLELLVNVPRRKAIGAPAPYRILVRNGGDQVAEEVDIHCQLDGPLTFNNTKQREVRRRLGRLLPGESQELTLNLLAKEPGNHCCRFSIKSRQQQESVEAVWKLVCVEFVPQQVQIELLGPALRTVGSRAEFNFKVTNRSKRPLSKVHLAMAHDAALVPVAATKGAIRADSHIDWDVTDLQVDESAHFQVEFDCRATAERACVQIETSGAGIQSDQSETCLRIVPASGNLDLRISDRDDPMVVGKRNQYEIIVHNTGRQSARAVRLDVNVPDSLKVISGQVSLGTTLLPLKYTLQNGSLQFDPVPDLASNSTMVYVIEVEALAAGTPDVRAVLRSSNSPIAISASEPAWITED